MPKYRLDLSYDGTAFRGYARQGSLRTVQGELESALGKILGRVPESAVAGRTDAGVHARHQVVSFESGQLETASLVRSLNSMLGGEIVVDSCTEVDPDFDARFSAKRRTYRYLASTAGTVDPMRRNQVWTFPASVETVLLQETAAHFVGEIDFTSFCRSVEGRSNVRRVDRAEWEPPSGELHTFWIVASSFCHQMVRSLVGLCYDVARGHTALEEVQAIVDRRDRSTMGTVAPPHGLMLWEVEY